MIRLIALLVVGSIAGLVGCATKKTTEAPTANASVLDVKPVRHATKPAVATSVAADPLPSDSIVYPRATAAPVAPAAPVMLASSAEPATAAPLPAAANTYKVKPGDTLYGIARATYGDGKQWTRIASANPGLSAKSLKAGQTITLP